MLSKKQIVFWLNMPSPHIMSFIEELNKLDFYKILCVFEQRIPKWRLDAGFEEYTGDVPYSYISESNWKNYINEICLEKKDALHVFGGFVGSLKIANALVFVAKSKIPYYVISEKNFIPDRKELLRNVIRIARMYYIKILYGKYCRGIFAMGSDAVSYFRKIGYRKERVHDFIYTVPALSEKKLKNNNEDNGTKLVYIGRLLARKGVKTLLHALSMLKSGNYGLKIIGDGPEKDNLIKIAKELKIQENVEFLGYKSNSDALRILSEGDFLVVPSLYDGWAAVVNESISAGIPVLCSSKASAKDIVTFTGAGVVFDPGNPKLLADVISSVSNKESIHRLKNYTRYASKRITPGIVADYFHKIIEATDISVYIPRPWHCLKCKNTKLLMSTPYFPPAYKAGGVVRAIESILKVLSAEFDISVITWDRDYEEPVPFDFVEHKKWVKINDTKVYFIDKTRRKTILEVLSLVAKDKSWIVYVNSLFASPFSVGAFLGYSINKGSRLLVVAPRGELSLQALSIHKKKKMAYLWIFKKLNIHKRAIFQATGLSEATDIRRVFGNATDIMVVPDISIAHSVGNIVNAYDKKEGELKIVMVARVTPIKNVDYAIECVSELSGNIKFEIIGPFVENWYVERCKKIIEKIPENIKVSLVGPLSHEQVLKRMQEYHLFFLPSGSECFGHVILEALTVGLPVLISDNTPWKKLEEKSAGWEISLKKRNEVIAILKMVQMMSKEQLMVWRTGAKKVASDFNTDRKNINATLALFEEAALRYMFSGKRTNQ